MIDLGFFGYSPCYFGDSLAIYHVHYIAVDTADRCTACFVSGTIDRLHSDKLVVVDIPQGLASVGFVVVG